MTRLLPTTVFACVFATSALAQTTDCATIKSDSSRLECYDLAHRKTLEVSNSGAWVVLDSRSKIDDSRNVSLTLDSAEPLAARFGRKQKATMVLVCGEKTTNFYIVFGGHFMSALQGGSKVTFRIDKLPAKTISLGESNDHTALGYWGGAKAIPFIKSLLKGDALYVRATPFNESIVEADFPIKGLAEAIKPLREACQW